MESPLPTALKIALAWTPLVLLWALFVRINGDVGILVSLRSGVMGIGTAAVLGLAVWWVTGRVGWPDPMRPSFYAVHAALGAAYSLAWLLGGDAATMLLVEGGLPADFLRVWSWENGVWRFLMGLWLYGLVAGVSYALRIRERLRDQERAAARLEALATRARLASLRARLNPHFLFNALNTVAALVPDDPEAAEGAVERLGDLLRYSLAESDGAVTLADEWAFTRAYLDMEALRLGHRLDVRADLPDGLLATPVLPFSLQTLVENAVRHAAAVREEGAVVRISAAADGGGVTVMVEDDGPGCVLDAPPGDGWTDASVDASAGESADGSPAGSGTGTGTGLRNLTERLRGAYGGRATLSLESAPGRGFRARLRLPAGGPTAVGSAEAAREGSRPAVRDPAGSGVDEGAAGAVRRVGPAPHQEEPS